ncbi:MAG: hypothetical protein GXP14_10295 [Gammaproteobacteria bacterium]|nr:hypothetical protein [Gammaproteobacteria bacterium]
MRKPLYIYSSSNFYHAVEDTLPSLKPILFAASGQKIRRIDRLTQLALIGSFQCQSTYEFAENTGLYMSSIYGSLNNTAAVLAEIYQEGQLPRPLNFINTVSNAACFYLAQYLGLSSNNQFVSRDHFTLEAGLKLASLDLEIGNVEAALVGVVCEVGENLTVHRQRFQIKQQYDLAEGSHWLYVAHHLDNATAIAKISHVAEPLNEQELDAYLLSEVGRHDVSTKMGFGDAVTIAQKEKLRQTLAVQEASYASQQWRHEFTTALQICGFLEACKIQSTPDRFIYLDTDRHQRWSVIVLDQSPQALDIARAVF